MRRVFAVAILATSCLCVSAQSKEQDIRRLLDMTGASALGMQVVQQMTVQMRQVLPQVPEEFWIEFAREISSDELVEEIVPIYDRHYTHEDILGMIAFYETDLGQKMIHETPGITQESMAAGQAWGMRIGLLIQHRLQSKGFL